VSLGHLFLDAKLFKSMLLLERMILLKCVDRSFYATWVMNFMDIQYRTEKPLL